MHNEMSDDERPATEKECREALAEYIRACGEQGMNQEETLAAISRRFRRMTSLVTEGFTWEQALKIFEKEEGAD